jgi:hypothetical protein
MAKDGDVQFVISATDEASKIFADFERNMQAGVAQVVQSFGSLTEGISREMDAFGESLNAVFALAMNPTPLGVLQAGLSGLGTAIKYFATESEAVFASRAKQADDMASAFKRAGDELDAMREKLNPTRPGGPVDLPNGPGHQPAQPSGFEAWLRRTFPTSGIGDLFQSGSEELFGPRQETADRTNDINGRLKEKERLQGEIAAQAEFELEMLRLNEESQARINNAMAERDRMSAEAAVRVSAQIAGDDARAAAIQSAYLTPLERYNEALKEIDALLNRQHLLPEQADRAREKAKKDYDDATKEPKKPKQAGGDGANMVESRFLTRGGDQWSSIKMTLEQQLEIQKRIHDQYRQAAKSGDIKALETAIKNMKLGNMQPI